MKSENRKKAIVLASGGLDSLVTAALALQECEVAFLHLNYGQRTEERELKAFNDIANHYGVDMRRVVNMDYLKQIGGSSLVDENMDMPMGSMPEENGIPSTYVPFRNGHLLCLAVSWAEVLGATGIFIGAVEQDSSGYPDCREEFYQAFEKAVELGTKPSTGIRIVRPLITLSKSDIVRKGMELNVPFDLSWSCYRSSDQACGECESCLLRLKGFADAGIKDPIPYAGK